MDKFLLSEQCEISVKFFDECFKNRNRIGTSLNFKYIFITITQNVKKFVTKKYTVEKVRNILNDILYNQYSTTVCTNRLKTTINLQKDVVRFTLSVQRCS